MINSAILKIILCVPPHAAVAVIFFSRQ
jgi:hypothetical protein